MLSKALIQLSADGWFCTPSWVVFWSEATQPYRLHGQVRSVYAKGDPPRQLLPVPQSCSQPLLTLHRRPSNRRPSNSSSFGSVSYRFTAPFLMSLGAHRSFLCPSSLQSLLPPVLSCNQILLGFKVRFPVDSQSLCQVPRLGSTQVPVSSY